MCFIISSFYGGLIKSINQSIRWVYGFRPGHSTELTALQLVNHIITEMDNYNVPTNIYLDLSKAFDTLNFDIFLYKLNHYGIQGYSNRLLRSYLTGRMQYVEYNGHKSAHLLISTGVPQGSVLGPLLFLEYINDLPLLSNVFKMLMYADETTLYCNIDQNVDEDTINNELAIIWEWLIANKLSLNTKKTKYMVFHTNQRNVTYPNLVINNSRIERVSHFNFLGIMLSYNMTWDAHINHFSKKISKAIGTLYQLKHIYPQRILFTLYTTLIVPHLIYCPILWGSCIKENHRLHLHQKKALRIITNSYYITHSEPIFKAVRCLKTTDMFSVAIWKFYFKLMNNKLPNCFSSYKPVLLVVNERYEIRYPGFHLPVINHKFAVQSLKYCLIRQLNMDQSSNIIADICRANSFKRSHVNFNKVLVLLTNDMYF